MATVKGEWVFNGTLTRLSNSQKVKFTCDGSSYTEMGCASISGGMWRFYYTPFKEVYIHGSGYYWLNEAHRTVDFGETAQTVSDDFYAWLTANATEQIVDILYSIYGSSITAIADSIRGKTGKTDALTLEQMVTEIEGIGGGSISRPVFESFVTDEIANHIVSAMVMPTSSLIEEIEE